MTAECVSVKTQLQSFGKAFGNFWATRLAIITLIVNTFPLKCRSKKNHLAQPPHQTQNKIFQNENKTLSEHGEPKVTILIPHFMFVLDLG